MGIVLQQLEVELGPDTAFLGIRIGLHSGPVTAGVLRGERARFQLFGDVSLILRALLPVRRDSVFSSILFVVLPRFRRL